MIPPTVGLLVLTLALLGVPAWGWLGARIGAVSLPRPDRWAIARPIPRFAGPALLLALLPVLGAGPALVLGLYALAGAVDDVRRLSPGAKAAAQLPGVVAAAWVTGRPEVGVATFVGANALNLLDHVDGMAGGAVLGSGLAASAGLGGAPELGGGLALAALGFLAWNRPPARYFLGDAGALSLGAALVLVWADAAWPLCLAGLAVPLADTTFVVARRLAAGTPPWTGGTDHSGHVLLRAGAPAWAVPLTSTALSATIPLAVGLGLDA